MTYALDTILAHIGDLDEDGALTVVNALKTRHDLAGSLFGRSDVETAWQEHLADTDTDVDPGDMPDDVWDRVRATYEWRKALDERLTERGWDIVAAAVAAALDPAV